MFSLMAQHVNKILSSLLVATFSSTTQGRFRCL
jgi:hypothetical protein